MYIYMCTYVHIRIDTRVCIYIYIYIYRGEAWGSPEHRGTLSLAIQQYMSDLPIYRRGWGGVRINVLWSALEQRCCYVDIPCGIQKGGVGEGVITSFEVR